MNAIPADLAGSFDFCWSTCAFEHLGSIERGLGFVEASLETLRPGGVAVHTTEFNLRDGDETIDDWPTVLFQKRHIEALAGTLRGRGYRMEPIDFGRGQKVLDGFVDLPPYGPEVSPAHLKLLVDGFPCTSIGLIVHKD
jgi:hypothetical protein